MTRRTSNDIAPDGCEPPRRGTMDGVIEHRRRHSRLCWPCSRARAAYVEEMTAKFETPDIDCHPRRVAFVQDYLFLIGAGETNAEALARRLGFRTTAALDARVRHAGLKPLHEQPLRASGCAA
ncbi:MAG TPA: hypothetical protein VJ851_00810 [Jatrophihabitans sp.]|nr:hypothetical protein [Jatrophihabitans sp.]